MAAIYGAYAPFYDGSGQVRFALLTRQYLGEVLARHPAPGRRALDLACGTGTLALALAESGWGAVGLDQSEETLEIARARALGAQGSVGFVQGDMRSFGNAACSMQQTSRSFCMLHAAFDLITCAYDSLNYLLAEDDLAACFQSVSESLSPGGLFYADMNTRHFLEHDWPACEVQERYGFVQVEQSRFDPATWTSTMRLTGFGGDDERGYVRFDETHVERAYPPEAVAGLLEAAGLRVAAAYECFTFQPHHERSQRIAWVARKPE